MSSSKGKTQATAKKSVKADVKETPKAMQVELGRLYYQRHVFDKWNFLPLLPMSTAGGENSLRPVQFDDEGTIHLMQKAQGNNAVLKLSKADYKLESVEVSTSFRVHYGDDIVIAIELACNRELECDITSSRGEKGMKKAQNFPLARAAPRMKFIRLELSDMSDHWRLSGRKNGKTVEQLAAQLQQLLGEAASTTTASDDILEEDESDLDAAPSTKEDPRPDLPHQSPETAAAVSYSKGRIANHQDAASTARVAPNPAKLSTTTSAIPPPSQRPTSRKRTLAEIDAQYDEIEKQEEDFLMQCRERKKKLKEERKGVLE